MRIEIGFGTGLTKVGKPIPGLQMLLDSIVHDASWWFGGCNLILGTGGWKPDTGRPAVQEASAVLVINSPFTSESQAGILFLDQAKAFAGVVRDRLSQESVVFTIIPATAALI